MRYPQSFPTRRSSELGGSLNWTSYMLIISHLGMAAQAVLFSNAFSFNVKHLAIVAIWTIANDARSEEHTSELQSRENLVCRLLHEKKNKKHTKDKQSK